MSSQYAIHIKSSKDTFINFNHFDSSEHTSPFVTFEISNDNNTFKMFMNSGGDHLTFLKNLAATVQEEIEKHKDLLHA